MPYHFGISLGLQVLGSLLTPAQTVGKLENKKLPDASYGSRIPLGYGAFPVRGILAVAPSEFTETKVRRGKIGGKVNEYTYSATLGYLLSRGVISKIAQLKLNGELEVDFLSTDPAKLKSSEEFWDTTEWRQGTLDQTTIAALDLIQSPAPAYRNIALVAFPDLGLTEKYGNRPPLVEALITTDGTTVVENINEISTSPVTWVANNGGTVDAPPDDVLIGRHGTATGTAANQYFRTTGPIDDLAGNFIEIIFDDTTNPDIRLMNDDVTPANATDFLFKAEYISSGTLHLLQSGGPITVASVDDTGNSLRIEFLGGDDIKVFVNGVEIIDYLNIGGSGNYYAGVTIGNGATVQSFRGFASNETTERVQLNTISLASVLDDICLNAGVAADTTDLGDQITGVELKGDSPKDWIEQLQRIFGFFVVPNGAGIKFLAGERPPAVREFATLDEFGLIEERPYSWEQKNISELPYEIEVTHFDIDEQQEVPQYWRNDTQAPGELPINQNKIQVNTGATMTPDEALGIAEMTATRLFQERETYTLKTTFENADLEPGDTIILPYLGEQQEFLILRLDYGANWMIDIQATRYTRAPWQLKRTPILDSTLETNPIAGSEARLFISELPQILSTHPTNPLYWSASQSSPEWRRMVLGASADSGNSFTEVADSTLGGVIGFTINELPSEGGSLDTNTTLRVKVSGVLSTITQATFDGANQVNWLVVGDEILKFRDATLLSSDTLFNYYELDYLRRGELGTPKGSNKPKFQIVALVSDLQVIDRDLIGGTGEIIEFQLFPDGTQSAKAPYPLTLL